MKLKERQSRGVSESTATTIVVFPTTSGEDGVLLVLIFDVVSCCRLVGVALGREKDESGTKVENDTNASGTTRPEKSLIGIAAEHGISP